MKDAIYLPLWNVNDPFTMSPGRRAAHHAQRLRHLPRGLRAERSDVAASPPGGWRPRSRCSSASRFVAFILVHLVPGNPAKVILYGSEATPQQIADLTTSSAWNSRGGCSTPVPRPAAHGNLGTSYATQTSVAHELLSRTPSTLS